MKREQNIEQRDLKLLVACCRIEPDSDEVESSILHSPLSILRLASRHGVLPLVYKTLKNYDDRNSNHASRITNHKGKASEETKPSTETQSPKRCSTPPNLPTAESSSLNAQRSALNAKILTELTELKTRYMNISQRNMFMSAELLRIMDLLKENDIEALAFKGPTLAQSAYGDITLRQYADLDLLIRKEERTRVANLLEARGYRTFYQLTGMQARAWYRFAKDMVFVHPETGISLEIHWRLFDEDFPVRFGTDALWRSSSRVEINGVSLPTFPDEELLIYLCLHGSKHLWERLAWIVDLDRLVRSRPLDWQRIVDRMDDGASRRMFYLGLFLSRELFDTPLPPSILEEIDREAKKLQALSAAVFSVWRAPRNMFWQTATMLHFFPDTGAKLRYLHKILLKPSYSEYSYIDLPDGFHWAYYLLRPWLLLRKYLGLRSRP